MMKFISDRKVIAAIVINLMPIAGIVLFGWSAFVLMLLYWLENVIIGVFTLARMLVGSFLRSPVTAIGAVPLGAFFVFHYGLFCFVHGIFVWTLFAPAGTDGAIGDPFDFPASVATALGNPDIFWGFVFLAAAHGVMFLLWTISGAWRDTHALNDFASPYARIVVLHVTLIFAGLPVLLLGEPMAGILILALIKMGLEVQQAVKHHFPIFDEADAEKAAQKLDALLKRGNQ